MATPLELSTGPGADGVPVVTAVGEIDMSNAGRFREALLGGATSARPSHRETLD
jgi:anti-sigma B factor antagonist